MIAAPVTSHIERLKEGENDTLLSASRGNQLIDLLNSLGAMEGRGGIKVIKSGSNFVITTSAEADAPDPFTLTPVNVFKHGATYRQCQVDTEGEDVLLCGTIDSIPSEQVYVAKPFLLRKATVDARAALGFQFINHFLGVRDVFSTLGGWPGGFGFTVLNEFIVTRTYDVLPGAFPSPRDNFPADQVLVIHPHYVQTYVIAPTVFSFLPAEIDVLNTRKTLFHFNPATLAVDANPALNTEPVTHLDLNTDARAWLPAAWTCNADTFSVVNSVPGVPQDLIALNGIMLR